VAGATMGVWELALSPGVELWCGVRGQSPPEAKQFFMILIENMCNISYNESTERGCQS